MTETGSQEHRVHKRIPFIKDVEVVGVGMRRCMDLSVGGMYLDTVVSFPIGDLLDLKFKLRDTDEHLIEVQARVLYGHEGIGVGLGFVNLSPEDHDKIHKFVEQG